MWQKTMMFLSIKFTWDLTLDNNYLNQMKSEILDLEL